MKPNKGLILSLIVLAQILSSCASKDISSAKAQEQLPEKIEVPNKPQLSSDSVDARINKDMNSQVSKVREGITLEALSLIEKTQDVLKEIDKGQNKAAENQLYELIGKMETLVTANPKLGLIPVNASTKRNELVTDINVIKNLVSTAQNAMKKGYYQEAREILDKLVSEQIITTYYIPLTSYPDGLKFAALKLKEDKPKLAKAAVMELLNTVVLEEMKLPLPVLKAEQYVAEASELNADDKKDEVFLLLENADYQLKLAEALGYGKRTKDFKDLADTIHSLKKDIAKKVAKDNIKHSFNELQEQLKAFRAKFFTKNN